MRYLICGKVWLFTPQMLHKAKEKESLCGRLWSLFLVPVSSQFSIIENKQQNRKCQLWETQIFPFLVLNCQQKNVSTSWKGSHPFFTTSSYQDAGSDVTISRAAMQDDAGNVWAVVRLLKASPWEDSYIYTYTQEGTGQQWVRHDRAGGGRNKCSLCCCRGIP